MRTKAGLAVALVVTIGSALIIWPAWFRASADGESGPARESSRSRIAALARLAPERGLVSVAARPGLRIELLKVKEGDRVERGAEIAVLEGRAQAERQLAAAKAQKERAESLLAIRRESDKLARSHEDLLIDATIDGKRRLVEALDKAISLAGELREKLVAAAAAEARSASIDLETAQLKIKRGETDGGLKKLEFDRKILAKKRELEDRRVEAEAGIGALAEQVLLAQTNLDSTGVIAPVSGVILDVLAREGESSSGAVVVMGDVARMAAEAEVFETDLADLELGAAAEVKILGVTYGGKVARIGTFIGKNRLRSLDPTAISDRRVAEVLITLDKSEPASRYVNMQVDVSIKRRASLR